MNTILIIIHIIVSLFLIVIVLLQHGKGADIGATFGGSSQTVFGTEGPLPLLNKVTTGAAVIFMITSISLAWYSAQISKGSVMRGIKSQSPPPVEQPAPAQQPLTVPMPQQEDTGKQPVFPAAPEKGEPQQGQAGEQ